jgi:hypothetical protein
MNTTTKLVKHALIQNFLAGYRCDDNRAAESVIAALEAAGLLRDQPMGHAEAVHVLR